MAETTFFIEEVRIYMNEKQGIVKAPDGWRPEDPTIYGGTAADLLSLYRLNQQRLQQGENPVDPEGERDVELADDVSVQTV